MSLRLLIVLAFVFALTLTGCGDDTDAPPPDGNGGSAEQECTEETKGQACPNISVWFSTCDGDVLQTPSGTGDKSCVNGECQVDMMIVETDCAAEGKTCGPNPEPNTQGDACI